MLFSVNAANMARQSTNAKCSISRPAANSAAIAGAPTPMVNLKLKTQKNQEESLVTLRALPDTGASVDCIEENFAKKHNLVIQPDSTNMIELVSAEGKTMRVSGTTKFTLQAPDGGWTTTVALVCPQLSHQFLLSWVMQKKLQLLHPGWPFSRIVGTNAASLLEIQTTLKHLLPRDQNPDPKTPIWPKPEWPQELKELCNEFSAVLVDELSHTMSTHGCRAPCWSQTLLREKTEENSSTQGRKRKERGEKLLKSGVIERILANKVAQWISPAGFVAKD